MPRIDRLRGLDLACVQSQHGGDYTTSRKIIIRYTGNLQRLSISLFLHYSLFRALAVLSGWRDRAEQKFYFQFSISEEARPAAGKANVTGYYMSGVTGLTTVTGQTLVVNLWQSRGSKISPY